MQSSGCSRNNGTINEIIQRYAVKCGKNFIRKLISNLENGSNYYNTFVYENDWNCW